MIKFYLVIMAVFLIVMGLNAWAQNPSETGESSIPIATPTKTGETRIKITPSIRPTPEKPRDTTHQPQPAKTVYQQVDKLVPGPEKTVYIEVPKPQSTKTVTITSPPPIEQQSVDPNSGFNTSLPPISVQVQGREKYRVDNQDQQIRVVEADVPGHETIIIPRDKASTPTPIPTSTTSSQTMVTTTVTISSTPSAAPAATLAQKPVTEDSLWVKAQKWIAGVFSSVGHAILWIVLLSLLVWGLIWLRNQFFPPPPPPAPAIPGPIAGAAVPVAAGPPPVTPGGPMSEAPAPPAW